jgi:uncharacterized protein
MRELRRKDRAITNDEAIAILRKTEYGVLSTITPDGKPYGVPLNFCYLDNSIYFHCAIEGRKIDNIKKTSLFHFAQLVIRKSCLINLELNMKA